MLISNSHNFIYIHLHKTAGTSVENALESTLAWNDIILGSTSYGVGLQNIYGPKFGLYKHSSARKVLGVVGTKIWNEYFSFSTVRNPYSLAVSQYEFSMRHLKKQSEIDRANYLTNKKATGWPWGYPGVKALMENGGINAKFSDFIRSPKLSKWEGFTSQKSQLCDDKGSLLVKMVVKMEDLSSSWPEICERLNIDYIKLEHLNISNNTQNNWRDFYRDESDILFIQDLFQEDFEFFNYSREMK